MSDRQENYAAAVGFCALGVTLLTWSWGVPFFIFAFGNDGWSRNQLLCEWFD